MKALFLNLVLMPVGTFSVIKKLTLLVEVRYVLVRRSHLRSRYGTVPPVASISMGYRSLTYLLFGDELPVVPLGPFGECLPCVVLHDSKSFSL